MFPNSCNIEIFTMTLSAEMPGQQIYWVLYSMLTLASLWHTHINWMHYTLRKNTSQCSRIIYFYSFSICCHT